MDYKDVVVDLGDLTGPDGNVFMVFANVRKAMLAEGCSDRDFKDWLTEAQSKDSYKDVLTFVSDSFTCITDISGYL